MTVINAGKPVSFAEIEDAFEKIMSPNNDNLLRRSGDLLDNRAGVRRIGIADRAISSREQEVRRAELQRAIQRDRSDALEARHRQE